MSSTPHPPPHPTATPCCFSSAIYGSDVYVCFFVVVLLLPLCCFAFSLSVMFPQGFFLSLSLTLFPCFSLNHILYSYAVAQRQVVISACSVSFLYLVFILFFFFCWGTYLHFSLLLFCVPFLTSPPPPLPSPLSLSPSCCFYLFSFLSLSYALPHPCFLWQFWTPPFYSSLPLTLLSLTHDLPPPPFLTSPYTPFLPLSPASLFGPRMSDAAQSAPR